MRAAKTEEIADRGGFRSLRIRLAGAIGPDNGREVGVAEEEDMVALVGLEVCGARRLDMTRQMDLYGAVAHATDALYALNNSKRLSFPIFAACSNRGGRSVMRGSMRTGRVGGAWQQANKGGGARGKSMRGVTEPSLYADSKLLRRRGDGCVAGQHARRRKIGVWGCGERQD